MSIAIACQDLKFNNIKAIIFDKDGTLEDSLLFWREIGIRRARLIDAQIPGVGEPLLMAFGIQDNVLDPTSLLAVGSQQENEIAAAAYIAETGRSWYEARKIAQEAFREISESKYLTKTAESATIFPEVKQTLQTLDQGGIKLGILSADSTAGVKNFVDSHQLQEFIQLCLGTDEENQIVKPDPRFFMQACQILGVAPNQTLMVGDSSEDMTMAKSAGAAGTIGICRSKNSILAAADRQISSLAEIRLCNS